MKIDIPADKAQVLKADSRGRVNLGRSYADQEVEVVVLEGEDTGLDLLDVLRRLETLEERLYETEQTELRELASQIRMEIGDAALEEAFNEEVKSADRGDTILYDEAGGRVENVSESENDE